MKDERLVKVLIVLLSLSWGFALGSMLSKVWP